MLRAWAGTLCFKLSFILRDWGERLYGYGKPPTH